MLDKPMHARPDTRDGREITEKVFDGHRELKARASSFSLLIISALSVAREALASYATIFFIGTTGSRAPSRA